MCHGEVRGVKGKGTLVVVGSSGVDGGVPHILPRPGMILRGKEWVWGSCIPGVDQRGGIGWQQSGEKHLLMREAQHLSPLKEAP
jgi:hypothetical protein